MVIVRKSRDTIFKEKMKTLEESVKCVLSYQLGIKEDNHVGKKYIHDWISPTNVIAWIGYDEKKQSLVFRLTDERYFPMIQEVCKVYEWKTLKDEPIIEY